MMRKWLSSLFALGGLFFTVVVYAGTQNIVPSTESFIASPADVVEFSLSYAEGSPETTGIGIKLHFDSSKLDFIRIDNTLDTELTLVSGVMADASDDDGSSDTDKKIVTAFGEVIDNFIDAGSMPAPLLTAKFKVRSTFSSETVINFTGTAGGSHSIRFAPVRVSLTDIIPPVFTAPATKTVEALSELTPVILVSPEVVDAISGPLVAVADINGPFAVGTHIITWTATDSANNSATAKQTLIVQDTTPPAINALADKEVVSTGDTTPVELDKVVATDLVDGEIIAVADVTGPFSVGTHTITWTATDVANNTAVATQSIIITAAIPVPASRDGGGGAMPLILVPLLLLLGVGRRFIRLKPIFISCALSVVALSYTLSSKPIAANEPLFSAIRAAVSEEYEPSLGINIEEPQAESDSVGGHPLPFVDIQRVARPYGENPTCDEISFDRDGWVADIPDSCAAGVDEMKRSAVTSALRFIQHGSIPEGIYTVLYEGVGTLKFSGIARDIGGTTVTTTNLEVKASLINVSIEDKIASDQVAGLRYQITATDPTNPIRNIRIVMPGSACLSDEGIWLTTPSDCTDKVSKPFAEILADDRNAILFNPDYIRELKPYKSIRMMNMIKASPAVPYNDCPNNNQECIYTELRWDMRAKMDDAVWGASSITPLIERYGRGAPLEVLIALANTLKADPWFTIPHSATDEYVTEFARLVKATLSPDLKPYIEYSNETWNNRFWATTYVRQKGVEEKLSLLRSDGSTIGCPSGDATDSTTCNQFWAGAFYTAKRSKEIFQLWEGVWEEGRSFVRVLSGYTPNVDQTFNMLNFGDTADYVDVFAIAPYFEGCRDRNAHSQGDCRDEARIPITINELAASGKDLDSMVDSLFELTNNANDRYGLDAMIAYIARQKATVAKFNVRLYSYEGGQHFAIPSTNIAADEVQLTTEQITGMRAAMAQASKDPRMKTAYLKLLEGWKAGGGESFTLYTMPQGYHEWGSFGLKDGLNAPLAESPKYDAAISFQRAQISPWFADVTLRKEQCNLDIDNNGTIHALTDGLLLQRYLSNFRGDRLINGAMADNAARAEAEDIEQYIEACLVVFDINGDGDTQGADGTLVLRYLFDFRGSTLVGGLADAAAYRNTAPSIEGYISSLLD